MVNTEILDEFYDNTIDNDFSNLIGNDPHEEKEDEKQLELSDSKSERNPRGTSWCTFSTTSGRHFNSFCHYLHSHGYEIMKSSEDNPYKVYVFGLTKERADLLERVFYGNQRLVPIQSSSKAA